MSHAVLLGRVSSISSPQSCGTTPMRCVRSTIKEDRWRFPATDTRVSQSMSRPPHVPHLPTRRGEASVGALSPKGPLEALTTPSCSTPKALLETTVLPLAQPPKRMDVLGLGEAMMDFSVFVPDQTLREVNVQAGGRRVIDLCERQKILADVEEEIDVRPAGSLTNTLVGLAQLSRADGGMPFRIGFAGCVGCCEMGEKYSAHMEQQAIEIFGCATQENQEGLTGCVIVLTTPDAQRSFLVNPGKGTLHLTEHLKLTIATSRVLVIEGYLFDIPWNVDRIREAVSIANENGTIVAITAGAADVVERKIQEFWEVIGMGVDIFLCNRLEAAALLKKDERCCAREVTVALSDFFQVVAVTDGSKGSYIAANKKLQTVPPTWLHNPPVDTCGAGDVYAAGLLLGMLRGYDLYEMGKAAATSATAVIAKQGGQLNAHDATGIVTKLSNDRMHRAASNDALQFEPV